MRELTDHKVNPANDVLTVPAVDEPGSRGVNHRLLEQAVSRFLAWPLPRDFAPDAGISFTPGHVTYGSLLWPTGTNLLNAIQARRMIEHVLGLARDED